MSFNLVIAFSLAIFGGTVFLIMYNPVKTSNDLFNRCDEICAPYDAILRKRSAEHCACNPCMILKKVEK